MSDDLRNAPLFSDVEQRSPDWHIGRLGKPTASQFHRVKILQSGKNKGDWSDETYNFLYELLAERRFKRSFRRKVDHYEAVKYGVDNEPNAARDFAKKYNLALGPGGFFDLGGRVACSPDRLIGSDEVLEIKCPTVQTQIGYLLEGLEEDHKPQVQGQLWITGRKQAHFWSWRHDMPPYYSSIVRDEIYITELARLIHQFCDRLDDDEKRLATKWPIA